ncbi:thiamine pyrophosphate-binding protein [Microbulbifer sp. TYP-18]|uniref:thiamine pyrophosphate-binding protein n=1 Tax=Microbulbifer sp. TYP-18 TaxID=3230024 RepID=UPI0034C69C6E
MSKEITVGDALVRTLEQQAVSAVYGVISIHNLPIADALGRRGSPRFVPARGEAGAVTMADAHGRQTGLGVALTSTGAGAGNAVGALLEALNAGTPLLHITGQVERQYLGRDAGFIHETQDQLGFLRACCKGAYRVTSAEQAVPIVRRAIREAMTAPMGPVSVEIPIDLQGALFDGFLPSAPVAPARPPALANCRVQALAQRLRTATRPLLWVGGGALGAGDAVRRLADAGLPVISSTHGRGIVPDSHPRSLRAFHNAEAVEALFAQSDLLIVAGSKLRSNETKTYSLALPEPLVQIDIDPAACHRNYRADEFIEGDCGEVLTALADCFDGESLADGQYDGDISSAIAQAEQKLRAQMGPYAVLCDAVRAALPADGLFVRDITMSGSTWGSRLLPIEFPNTNIHSLAGAIGMGLPMAIGSAVAQPGRKVLGLVGDGGLMLGVGEIATMVQENLDLTLLVMNDGGYGVMRGIQRNHFSDRQYYNTLLTPQFTTLADSMGLKHWQIRDASQASELLFQAVSHAGPALVEVDMACFGELKFAGPPQRKLF